MPKSPKCLKNLAFVSQFHTGSDATDTSSFAFVQTLALSGKEQI
jgi:hypothetical protein